MNDKIIENIQFFQDKPPPFLAAILPLLKPIKIDVNQYLYMKGDPANESIHKNHENYKIYNLL